MIHHFTAELSHKEAVEDGSTIGGSRKSLDVESFQVEKPYIWKPGNFFRVPVCDW